MGAIISIAIIIVSILGFSSWYFFQHEPPIDSSTLITEITAVPTQTNEEHGGVKLSTLDGTPIISPTSTPEMKTFSKEIQTIDNQAVILYKPTVTTSTTPIIIYSHGSNEHVTTNGPTPQFFVEALDTYGNYFAQNGILFIASEMYGENWGSTESLNHLKALIEHIQNEYEIESKPNLYGFSMGGLPTLRFAKAYPDSINKIALLAPTINMPDWNEASLRTLIDIPIRIWHGTKDVNVPPTLSEAFYQASVAAGNTTITRNTITNETHRHFLKPDTLLEFIEPER